MYCGKCGAENQPGAAFCGACGAPLAAGTPAESVTGQAPPPAQKPVSAQNSGRNKKIGIAAVAAAAVIVIIVVAVSLFGGRGPEATAEQFFDVVLDGQAEKIIDLVPKGMVKAVMEESGLSRAEVAEEFSQLVGELDDAMTVLGDGVSLTYDAIGSEDVSSAQLASIQEQYEQMNVNVTAAKTVEMEFHFRIDSWGVDETDTFDIPVIKVGGSWYIDIADLDL